jgi:hypothetical protein
MKNIILPTLIPDNQKYVLKYENTPIANIIFKTINVEGDGKIVKKIGLFYERLTKKFADWANGNFKTYAERSYEADTNPRKKYRYRPLSLCYDMSADIIKNTYLSVEINITLIKEGKTVGRRKINHLWDLSKGILRK